MSSSGSSREASPARNPRSSRRVRKDPQTPQQKIDEIWAKYRTKAPGKATSIIPQSEYAERAARRASVKSKAPATTTEQSYEAAADQCRRKVAQIVKECRRVNQKYRDPHFDLEIDQKLSRRDCLDSLDNERDDHRCFGGRGPRTGRSSRRRQLPHKDRDELQAEQAASSGSVLGLLGAVEKERERASPLPDGDGERMFRPQAVKRVVDIFDAPQFFIDGPTANDVRQGRDGDCWLMAALCTLSNKPGLIERCCVAHDQAVGVYGFVFHRDGEWFSEIIDDKLYLTKPDYDESLVERILWEDRERVNSEEAYRKIYQSNSGALYFAQCEHPNETWLPLLEKAYAKAHGDYSAIEGGYGGEGIEDLTGGVTSEIYTTDILDKEHFWNEELMNVNQDFLFGCSTGVWGRGWGERKGIVELHAYSVLKAREIDGVRLVLLKNPWGKHEWKGAWSDGSKEWTAEWLQKLDHKFGDDGSFWINYEDLLRKYQAFDRTRLFGPEWKVAQIWTTLNVAWTLDYHETKFAFSLARSGPVVIVFSQLDERYFKGLEGQYRFELSFRVHDKTHGGGGEDYVVRSQNYYRMNRSVNVELDLTAGEYVVVVRIDAQRNDRIMPVEEVVRAHAKDRREKLMRIGLAYDVAHSKGKIVESAEEKDAREAYELRKRERERKRMARFIREDKRDAKKAALRERMKARRAREKAEARSRAKDERKAARREARMKAEEDEEERKKQEAKGESKKEEEEKNSPKKENVDKAAQVGGEPAPSPAVDQKPEKSQADATATTRDSSTQAMADEQSVKPNIAPEAAKQGEGSASSTEPGENTPASSMGSTNGLVEDEDPQDEEAYVTAAEEDIDSEAVQDDTGEKRVASTEECPATPKPAKPPTAIPGDPSTPASVDVGVQTGPGLPFPPPPVRRGPPPGFPGIYSSSPLPGTHLHYGPPRGHPVPRGELAYVPAHHLRAAYGPGATGAGPVPGTRRQEMPPPSDCTVLSTSDSDSELEGDGADDVSDISEQHIDECLAADRARAARAAASAAASAASKTAPGQAGSVSVEEPLDEFEKDPWNAVGVFGLRVYYKVPDDGVGTEAAVVEQEGVKLRVERPNPFVWDESSDEEEADDEKDGEDKKKLEKEESKVLDVDDSAKDAVGEQPPTPSTDEPGKGDDKQVKDGIEGTKSPAIKTEDGNSMKTDVEGPSKAKAEAPIVVKVEERPVKKLSTNPEAKEEKGLEAQNAK